MVVTQGFSAAPDRLREAAAWLDRGDALRAAAALGALLGEPQAVPKLRRQVLYEAAATLQENPQAPAELPPALRGLARVPDVGAAEVRLIQREMAALFDPFEDSAEPHPDLIQSINGPLYLVCMTPRSGSTFLARCLNDAKTFGRPGEYFHRNAETAIAEIAAKFKTPTLESYIARVIYHSQSANGACGIKTDLGSIIPLVAEGVLDRLLPHAKIIYLTRCDVLMQAISLARAQITGAWSSRMEAKDGATYRFEHILNALRYTTTMMARWETLFAAYAITPLRISYEAIDRDVDGVIGEIAGWIGVPAPAVQFTRQRESVQRDAANIVWRDRFLAEFGGA